MPEPGPRPTRLRDCGASPATGRSVDSVIRSTSCFLFAMISLPLHRRHLDEVTHLEQHAAQRGGVRRSRRRWWCRRPSALSVRLIVSACPIPERICFTVSRLAVASVGNHGRVMRRALAADYWIASHRQTSWRAR